MKLNAFILAAVVALGATTSTAFAAESSSATAAAPEKNGPQIQFAEKVHNFGYINEKGGPATCDFEFVNTGDAPLVIISATASCGCYEPVTIHNAEAVNKSYPTFFDDFAALGGEVSEV